MCNFGDLFVSDSIWGWNINGEPKEYIISKISPFGKIYVSITICEKSNKEGVERFWVLKEKSSFKGEYFTTEKELLNSEMPWCLKKNKK